VVSSPAQIRQNEPMGAPQNENPPLGRVLCDSVRLVRKRRVCAYDPPDSSKWLITLFASVVKPSASANVSCVPLSGAIVRSRVRTVRKAPAHFMSYLIPSGAQPNPWSAQSCHPNGWSACMSGSTLNTPLRFIVRMHTSRVDASTSQPPE